MAYDFKKNIMIKNDEIFYKICFDNILEGICITDHKGIIVMNNIPLEEIFGYDKGEMLNKNIEILIPYEFRKIHQKHFADYFKIPKKYKKGKGREFYGLHKNGDVLHVEIGLNHFDYQGKTYAKALITDISSRKKNELKLKELNIELEDEVKNQTKELTQAVTQLKLSNKNLRKEIKNKISAENKVKKAFQKEKELNLLQAKFLSLVSHEFKTPLSGILTSISLIEKYNKINLNVNINNHVLTIKKLVYQLNSVLDDFLYLEKTEIKKVKYEITKFLFCDFLTEIIINLKTVLKNGQKIEFIPNKEKTIVFQDKKIVDIILRNILYNAIKYSPDHSVIKIKVSSNKYIIVKISDNGIGIPLKDQKHIFERFFRAKNALHYQGTGIGLNIVKYHIEELGGTISFTSKENKGSTFIIKLPIILKF
jgi:PAS domain S-box-containing protein